MRAKVMIPFVGFLALSGCTVETQPRQVVERDVVVQQQPAPAVVERDVIVQRQPVVEKEVVVIQEPPPRVEVVTARPRPNAVWVKGHWVREGKGHRWVPGYWR